MKYRVCHLKAEEAERKVQTGEPGVIVCVPSRGTISHETHLALSMNLRDVKTVNVSIARRPTVEARNVLAKEALKLSKENPFDFVPSDFFVLSVDSDAWWPPGTVSNMVGCLRRIRELDAIFGNFGGRVPYSQTFAMRNANDAKSFPRPGVDCANDEIVEIERAGFHFVLMRASLLQRVGEDPFTIPEGPFIGEDYAFCDRANAVSARLGVAVGLPVLHVDETDGAAYTPGMPAMRIDGNELVALSPEHGVGGIPKVPEQREYGDAIGKTA